MKKLFSTMLLLITCSMSGIAAEYTTYFITLSQGVGYKNANYINNTVGMPFQSTGNYGSLYYQLNFIDKKYSFFLEMHGYAAKQKKDKIKTTYEDAYLFFGFGKGLAKKWELQAALGISQAELTVKKEILSNPSDSLFNQFQLATNEYKSKWTPCVKVGIRYFLYRNRADDFNISLLASGIYKLKTEKFFEKQAISNMLLTVGLNFGIKLR
jgi:hypothetical protein